LVISYFYSSWCTKGNPPFDFGTFDFGTCYFGTSYFGTSTSAPELRHLNFGTVKSARPPFFGDVSTGAYSECRL
jgi:hypothetical protein